MVQGSDIEATLLQLGKHLEAEAGSCVADVASAAVREQANGWEDGPHHGCLEAGDRRTTTARSCGGRGSSNISV
jgi:hypothetical protein